MKGLIFSKGEIIECLNCGKPLVYEQIRKNVKCCCQKCAGEYRHKITSKNKVKKCLYCGKDLTMKQIGKSGRFCCKSHGLSYRQQSHDPNFFELEDKHFLYYILGLIYTDGNIDKDIDRITLSFIDYDLVEMLYPIFCDTQKRKICVYQPKGFKNAHETYTIHNSNKAAIKKLIKIGFAPHNSLTKEFPLIEDDYLIDFMRGVFYADGAIYISNKKYNYIGFKITSGSENYAIGISNALKKLGFSPTITTDSRIDRDNKTYYINLNRQNEIKNCMELLYSNKNYYIDRKYEKFKNIA